MSILHSDVLTTRFKETHKQMLLVLIVLIPSERKTTDHFLVWDFPHSPLEFVEQLLQEMGS